MNLPSSTQYSPVGVRDGIYVGLLDGWKDSVVVGVAEIAGVGFVLIDGEGDGCCEFLGHRLSLSLSLEMRKSEKCYEKRHWSP